MAMHDFIEKQALSLTNRILKRSFDFTVSLIALALCGWLIVIVFIIASIDTRRNGFFTQVRIGQFGKPFKVIKIRTMRDIEGINTVVTTGHDPRITRIGRILRLSKLDELPQLLNVINGQMSFVGPRPDIPRFADELNGEDRLILSVRPGITGPASLKWRDEELLLMEQDNPEKYNQEVVYPNKTKLNVEYVKNYSFRKDLLFIWYTLFKSGPV